MFPYDTFALAVGMLFGAFGSICGRQLTNLLLFNYLDPPSPRFPAKFNCR